MWVVVAVTAIVICALPAAADSPPDESTTHIVSLVPNLTELSFALGAGNQVVGVSDFCRYPTEALTRPSVGGLVNPGLEATLRLRPTVVLLYRSQTDFATRLRQLGVATELFQVDTIADMYSAIGRLGIVAGKTTEAAALAGNIQAGLEQVRRESAPTVGDAIPAPAGIVIVSRDPAGLRSMYQASAGNFLGELFQIAGGRLAISGSSAVSREEIIRANPSLIIDMSSGEVSEKATPPNRSLGPWAELSTVGAVKSGQAYHWKNAHAKLLGPSVVDTAREMKRLVDAARMK